MNDAVAERRQQEGNRQAHNAYKRRPVSGVLLPSPISSSHVCAVRGSRVHRSANQNGPARAATAHNSGTNRELPILVGRE